MGKNYKIFYYILFIVVILGTVELASWGILSINDNFPSRVKIQKTLDSPSKYQGNPTIAFTDNQSSSSMRDHVLHPYLGFVRNYQKPTHIFNREIVAVKVNKYGFFGDVPPNVKSEDEIIIAITGGSVALDLFLSERDHFQNELKKASAFANKHIKIVSIALGGMKQPQQLMALNYFLTLGLHFDIVVNLDGFNEVVLPFSDNIPFKVFPYYPRSWQVYAANMIDIDTAILYGKIFGGKRKFDRWRNFISKPPYRHSNFFLMLCHMLKRNEEAQRQSLELNLRNLLAQEKLLTAQETGPPYIIQEDIFSDCVQVWKQASMQMWKLCKANGIRYIHLLQPNQYVKGSKRLTDKEEKLLAIGGPEYVYRQGAEQGYPYLIAAGKSLKQVGLPFTDFTDIFKDEQGTIYKDNCCHFNDRGNKILAARIASLLAE